MKTAISLCLSLLLAAPAAAIADPDLSTANTTDNPYAQYDPDGVPLEISQGGSQKRKVPTAVQVEALRKQQEQIAYDKNWLLRGYEEQLRLHSSQAAAKIPDSSSNLYYQLSMNHDLAKLARLPEMGSAGSQLLHAGSTTDTSHSATLRTADESGTPPSHLGLDNYRPLISPLSAVDSISELVPNFAPGSSLPKNDYQSSTDVALGKTKSESPSNPPDTVDLETPGLVAAKSDGLSDPNLTDLNVDTLPGETIEQARARLAADNLQQLPVAVNADELHRQQEQKTGLPAARQAPTLSLTQPPVAQPVVPQAPEVPMPVNRVPQINPVRSPIADPYDILNQ